MRVSVVIPASRAPARMGRFLPLVPLSGKPCILHLVQAFHDAGVEDVIVVVGHRRKEMEAHLAPMGARTVPNPDVYRGMFHAVRCGCRAVPPQAEAFFLIPANVPLVRPWTLRMLLEAYASGHSTVLYPVFQKIRGHPPLIHSRVLGDVEKASEGVTMRDVLASYEEEAGDLEVPDRNVTFSVNRSGELAGLIERWHAYDVPTVDECEALYRSLGPISPALKNHCRMVARVADRIAHALNQRGEQLDRELVRAAACLHDIAKDQTDHAEAGGRLLRKMGFGLVGDVVAHHTDMDPPDTPRIGEDEVLYMADKLVAGDRLVPIEQRFQSALDRFGPDPAALNGIRKRFRQTLAVKTRMENRLAVPLDEIFQAGP